MNEWTFVCFTRFTRSFIMQLLGCVCRHGRSVLCPRPHHPRQDVHELPGTGQLPVQWRSAIHTHTPHISLTPPHPSSHTLTSPFCPTRRQLLGDRHRLRQLRHHLRLPHREGRRQLWGRLRSGLLQEPQGPSSRHPARRPPETGGYLHGRTVSACPAVRSLLKSKELLRNLAGSEAWKEEEGEWESVCVKTDRCQK